MKTTLAILTVLLSFTSMAKGLACGYGAMSPMEARLERTCGNTEAESTRIQNVQRKSARMKKAVVDAEVKSARETRERVKNSSCCCGRKTVKKSCTKTKTVTTTECSNGAKCTTVRSTSGCGKTAK